MKEFLASNGGLLATIVLVAMCLNFVLMGAQKALELIKDKTSSLLDDKAYAVVSKVTSFLSSIIDWLGANRAH